MQKVKEQAQYELEQNEDYHYKTAKLENSIPHESHQVVHVDKARLSKHDRKRLRNVSWLINFFRW